MNRMGHSVLANGLSLLRVALAPAVVYSLYLDAGGDGDGGRTLALLVSAGLTDLLDGMAARRLGQTTRVGRLLDPLADKIFIAAVCIALVAWRQFPLWLLAMQVARDAAIVAAGAVLLRCRRQVITASLLGKVTTWLMSLAILAHVMAAGAPLRAPLQALAAVLVVLSGLDYARQFLAILRAPNPSRQDA